MPLPFATLALLQSAGGGGGGLIRGFVAIGIVTCAVHSKQYRRQQTRDIFRYSFVLW